MNHQPSHGSPGARGREAAPWSGNGLGAQQPGTGQGRGLDEPWAGERQQPAPPAWRDDRPAGRRGRREASVAPSEWAGPPAAPNGTYPPRAGRGASAGGQTITVSVPALRIFLTLAAVVVLSVVLSVIATLTVIAVMNAGVILPQYARLNQPTQVSQLGVCVSKTGRVWTPSNAGFCHGGTFVHVQPKISHP